jgi:hypothetical protein
MKSVNHLALLIVSAALVMTCAGCGPGGAELGSVTGRVTLDGQPVAGASIEFQPESGSPSIAITDDDGNYEMLYTRDRKGARIGTHEVTISGGKNISVPKKYARKSDLVVEVKSGSNVHNFELTSK